MKPCSRYGNRISGNSTASSPGNGRSLLARGGALDQACKRLEARRNTGQPVADLLSALRSEPIGRKDHADGRDGCAVRIANGLCDTADARPEATALLDAVTHPLRLRDLAENPVTRLGWQLMPAVVTESPVALLSGQSGQGGSARGPRPDLRNPAETGVHPDRVRTLEPLQIDEIAAVGPREGAGGMVAPAQLTQVRDRLAAEVDGAEPDGGQPHDARTEAPARPDPLDQVHLLEAGQEPVCRTLGQFGRRGALHQGELWLFGREDAKHARNTVDDLDHCDELLSRYRLAESDRVGSWIPPWNM